MVRLARALTERLASGRVKTVEVPGLAASMSIVGVRGDNLLITHYWPELMAGDCGTPRVREALALFNPVTRSETVLTRLGRDESWTMTLAAAEVRAWSP